jgi:hypothetical protein
VFTENGHTALKTTGINFACLIKVKQYSKSSNPLIKKKNKKTEHRDIKPLCSVYYLRDSPQRLAPSAC